MSQRLFPGVGAIIVLLCIASEALAQSVPDIRVNFLREAPFTDIEEARMLIQGDRVDLHTTTAAVEVVDGSKSLVLGSTSVPGKSRALSFAVILRHRSGKTSFLPFEYWGEQEIRTYSGDVVSLEQNVGDEQGEIEALEASIAKKEASLADYREKIDRAIGMERLAALEDEKKDLRTETRELRVTADQLATTVQRLGTQKRPSNFSARQSELTEQLRLLADKTRSVESSERGRERNSKAAIAAKQAQIAEVRDLKVQDLQAEVLRLKNLQLQLQNSLKMTDQELEEYMKY